MRIIVNHLTRMNEGYICVAGIDVRSGQHIRPVQTRRLTTDLLATNGGPFALASLVDLGAVTLHGSPPEVEDHFFNPFQARLIHEVTHEHFWKLLQNVAKTSILDIFGPAIKSSNRGYVVDKGTGEASLGCLIPADLPHIYIDNYGKIRIQMTDGNLAVNLSVTDIRLFETDHQTPKADLIRNFDMQMQQRASVILSLGLARAWQRPGDTAERHWLQVNNIHFEEPIN